MDVADPLGPTPKRVSGLIGLDIQALKADWGKGISPSELATKYNIPRDFVYEIAEKNNWPRQQDKKPADPNQVKEQVASARTLDREVRKLQGDTLRLGVSTDKLEVHETHEQLLALVLHHGEALLNRIGALSNSGYDVGACAGAFSKVGATLHRAVAMDRLVRGLSTVNVSVETNVLERALRAAQLNKAIELGVDPNMITLEGKVVE